MNGEQLDDEDERGESSSICAEPVFIQKLLLAVL